jgi:hypothetical protein
VNGQSRQLCRPKLIPSCLDAVGGYCDRVTTPLPCSRTNGAGSCIGQRTCLGGPQRFDTCGAVSPQCKTDCSMQDPQGCIESYCAAATSTPVNCGACGNTCSGYTKPNDNVTCQNGTTCTFSCQGENYDVNRSAADGCEAVDSPVGSHTQGSAASAGTLPCFDGSSNPKISGRIVSDARVHENSSIVGFSATTGAAPDWYQIAATGGSCQDDIGLTLQITGSAQPNCYRLTVITDIIGSFAVPTDGSGTATITKGVSSYSDNSTIYIMVDKTCGTTLTENVTYTVNGHL